MAQIAGNEPFYPAPRHNQETGVINGFDYGVTIRQEAILRFMVALASNWANATNAAEAAESFSDAYIKILNNDRERTAD